ncbi:MAG: hypothetical protein OXC30_00315 [Alphaproteobacteria bacterium]|nr:hypothetical protein [Alphaproteobacteria bacterium]
MQLLLLTCLYVGPCLVLNCAVRDSNLVESPAELTRDQAYQNRVLFLENLSFEDRVQQSSWWALDQLGVETECKEKILDAMSTFHIESSGDVTLSVANNVYWIVAEYYKKKYCPADPTTPIDKKMQDEHIDNMRRKNFRINMPIFYYAFSLLRQEKSMRPQRVEFICKASKSLLFALQFFCTHSDSMPAELRYSIFQKLMGFYNEEGANARQ